VNRFLFLVGNHFAILSIAADLQTAVATTFLAGPALDWAIDHTFTDFAEFRTLLIQAFVPFNHNLQAREALHHIRQTSTVVAYVNAFRQACILVNDLLPAERFHRFSAGLKPHIRQQLLIHDVQTFDEAAAMAIRVDMAYQNTPSTPTTSNTTTPTTTPRPLSRLNATTSTPTSTSTFTTTSGPKPKLTPEARAELIASNGCFYCRQTGHSVANCPTCPSNLSGKGPGTQ
jgi:hypothetical protein